MLVTTLPSWAANSPWELRMEVVATGGSREWKRCPLVGAPDGSGTARRNHGPRGRRRPSPPAVTARTPVPAITVRPTRHPRRSPRRPTSGPVDHRPRRRQLCLRPRPTQRPPLPPLPPRMTTANDVGRHRQPPPASRSSSPPPPKPPTPSPAPPTIANTVRRAR